MPTATYTTENGNLTIRPKGQGYGIYDKNGTFKGNLSYEDVLASVAGGNFIEVPGTAKPVEPQPAPYTTFDPAKGDITFVKNSGYFQTVDGQVVQLTDHQGRVIMGGDPDLYNKLQSGQIPSNNASSVTQVRAAAKNKPFVVQGGGTTTSTQNGVTTTTTTSPNENLGGGTFTSSTGANAGRTAVTLGNGQTVYYDNSGKAYSEAGTPVSNDVIARATSSTSPIPELAAPAQQTAQSDAQLQAILNNPSLSADQKAVIQSIYGAVSSNDADTAQRIKAAMEAATKYSDPYFKAQVQLATDALSRGLESEDGDLAFQENSLRNALAKLSLDTESSKEMLSFEHAQELKQLAQKYETDLEDTRTNLAATGFTNSSRRAQTEKILGDTNEGLVESSTKTYGYQTGNLDRALSFGQTNTQNQINNLQRLASEGKLNLLRTAESQVGSQTLGNLGYSGLVGGVGGSIPRQQAQDALSFANSFVF